MADNSKLLELVGQITLFPETHKQVTWMRIYEPKTREEILASTGCGTACKTAGCFAGQAAFRFSPPGSIFSPRYDAEVFIPDVHGDYVYQGGRIQPCPLFAYKNLLRKVRIDTYAKEILGLTASQADFLFAGDRTVKQLLAGVRCIIRKPAATYMDLQRAAGL